MNKRPAFAFLRRGDDPPIVPRSGWAAALTALTALAMSYLAVLTLSAGIAAERLAETWGSELAGVATVRISVPADALEARVTAVLADEPTGNVDPEMGARILRLLVDLNGLGKTIVVATHDLGLIRSAKGAVAARTLRLAGGRLVQGAAAL